MSADNKGVFVNGKKQIIELLQFLPQSERETLLRNMQSRNPSLTKDLRESSLSFENIENLDDEALEMLCRYVKAPIWGIALKFSKKNFQRRVLSLMPRHLAEQAYEILLKEIPNELRDSKRARAKIIDAAIALSKKRIIQL